jgi:lipoprotein-anchoring transpeptidase ErfK/SrfK
MRQQEGDAMKAQMFSNLATAAVMAMTMTAAAQSTTQAASHDAGPDAAKAKRVIVVSLEDRKLALVENGQVKKVYSVSVGKPSTPSPTGTFTIERRVANPVYHHNGKTVQPGPGNPVGTRWMGLSKTGYGIHGTNEPKSIGKAASHGCIRMGQADLEEFYAQVEVGDTVELIGERNKETVRVFGSQTVPAALGTVETAQIDDATPAQADATKTVAADTGADLQ